MVRKLYSAFARLVFREPFAEIPYGFIAGIYPDMFFEGRKVDDIMFMPVSRHPPRDAFFGSW